MAAESDDIRLIEEELVGSLPIEMLGSAMSQAKHVGPDVLHRVQVAAVLGRERAGKAALEMPPDGTVAETPAAEVSADAA